MKKTKLEKGQAFGKTWSDCCTVPVSVFSFDIALFLFI